MASNFQFLSSYIVLTIALMFLAQFHGCQGFPTSNWESNGVGGVGVDLEGFGISNISARDRGDGSFALAKPFGWL